jgi:hypothetical protein
MPLWSMDEWQYLEREVVTDPKGRRWTVALMDVLGQEGDPDMPNKLLEIQYSSGRFFTLIYSESGSAATHHYQRRRTPMETCSSASSMAASIRRSRYFAKTWKIDVRTLTAWLALASFLHRAKSLPRPHLFEPRYLLNRSCGL